MFQIDHVAISVKDIRKSIAFYESLDFKVTDSHISNDGSSRLYTLKDKAGIMLELINYTHYHHAPHHSHNLNTDLHVIGVKHFGLRVDYIHKAYAKLKKKGFIPHTRVHAGRLGRDYFFIKDPNGILLEIIEEHPRGDYKWGI